jgi:predicted enzyme related to lactoylglutathione lyase
MSGELSHFELGVPDVERAKRFYAELFGWSFSDTPGGARIGAGDFQGGVHPDEAPTITMFFNVPDLDGAARRIRELGGEVEEGGTEGDDGRFRYCCRDDQGVAFGLFEPAR